MAHGEDAGVIVTARTDTAAPADAIQPCLQQHRRGIAGHRTCQRLAAVLVRRSGEASHTYSCAAPPALLRVACWHQ